MDKRLIEYRDRHMPLAPPFDDAGPLIDPSEQFQR
jgi:hypothetical protein